MNKFINKQSDHYDFFFFPDSLAEKEIDKIVQIQEEAYAKILKFLNVENNQRIKYFLYPTNKIKGELTGDDGNGHAERETFEVHAVYNEDTKCIGAHEDTHLLSTPLGLPPQLLREGLAEHLSGSWHNMSHDKWAVQFLNENKVSDLSKMIDDEEWYEWDDRIAYPIAGSFITYLINKLGQEKFLELYKSLSRDFDVQKNTLLFEKITNTTITDAQAQWQNYLKRQGAE